MPGNATITESRRSGRNYDSWDMVEIEPTEVDMTGRDPNGTLDLLEPSLPYNDWTDNVSVYGDGPDEGSGLVNPGSSWSSGTSVGG